MKWSQMMSFWKCWLIRGRGECNRLVRKDAPSLFFSFASVVTQQAPPASLCLSEYNKLWRLWKLLVCSDYWRVWLCHTSVLVEERGVKGNPTTSDRIHPGWVVSLSPTLYEIWINLTAVSEWAVVRLTCCERAGCHTATGNRAREQTCAVRTEASWFLSESLTVNCRNSYSGYDPTAAAVLLYLTSNPAVKLIH